MQSIWSLSQTTMKELERCSYPGGGRQVKHGAKCWLTAAISQLVILFLTCRLFFKIIFWCKILPHSFVVWQKASYYQRLGRVKESLKKIRKGFFAVIVTRITPKIQTADTKKCIQQLVWLKKTLQKKRSNAHVQYEYAKAWKIHNHIPSGLTSKYTVFLQITNFLWAQLLSIHWTRHGWLMCTHGGQCMIQSAYFWTSCALNVYVIESWS